MSTEPNEDQGDEPKRKRQRSGKRAWVFQYPGHVASYGTEKASWYVGWTDPNGKRRAQSCGPGKQGLKDATRLADKRHSELVTETYGDKSKTTWDEFYATYKGRVIDRTKNHHSAGSARRSLAVFKRLMNPGLVRSIDSGFIEDFITKRMKPIERKGKLVSVLPATINRDLRYVRHALRRAEEWGFISKVPKIRFDKLEEHEPTYVPPEHFAAIYAACGAVKRPKGIPNVSPADWWRALLVMAYMTGWRIGQIKALKWTDIDLEGGMALSRAEDNKGKRDVRIPLNQVIVDHLQKIKASEWHSPRVFAWDTSYRALWVYFDKIQRAARLEGDKPLPKAGKHGRWYGFHDLRRGFATMNAGNMDLFELQALMQHKSLETTKLYVAMAKRLEKPVANLYVPDVARKSS